MKRSVNTTFLFGLLPLFSFLFVLLFGVFEWATYRNAEKQLHEHLDNLASSQSIILGEPVMEIVTGRKDGHLGLMLATLISDEDVVGVAVYDVDGNTLDSFGDLTPGESVLTTRVSINSAVGQDFAKVGELAVAVTNERILSELRERLLFESVLGIVLLMSMVVGTWALHKKTVMRPVRHLLDIMKYTEGGPRHRHIEHSSEDEFGEMFDAYNEMQDRLIRYESELLKNRNRYERLFEHSEVPIWNIDFSRLQEVFELFKSHREESLREFFISDETCGVARFTDLVQINEVNDATVNMLEAASRDAALSHLRKQIAGPLFETLVGVACAIYDKEEVYRAEIVLESLAGNRIEASLSLYIPQSNSLLSSVPVNVVDVTERNRAEQAIKSALKEAERANSVKSEFLASMSHELRTPLNAILGFAQMLQYASVDTPEESKMEYLNSIISGGNHLLHLVNEVLDLARIEANQLELYPEETDIHAVIRQCIELTMPIARQKGIEVSVDLKDDEPHLVMTDEFRVKQCLLNLLSNAVKYNQEAGSVTVNAEARPGDVLRIYIADTGRGIEPDELPHLFQMFRRLQVDAKTTREGSGIGLTVAKHLIERMGGRIGVESEQGKGSVFWVDLPMVINRQAIIWTEQLRVGVDAIDSDHQQLCAMLNECMYCIADDGEPLSLMDRLVDFANYVVRQEQQILRFSGVNSTQRISEDRVHFLSDITARLEQYRQSKSPSAAAELYAVMHDWFCEHILSKNSLIRNAVQGRERQIHTLTEGNLYIENVSREAGAGGA